MAEVDFMSVHKSTQRNYLARVNDPEFPKPKLQYLLRNLTLTIGMVIVAFAMAAIAI